MTKNHYHFEPLSDLPFQLARLFELICQGGRRSEHVIAVQTIGKQKIRLKLVAEVIDAGPNPLQTHGTLNSTAEGCEGKDQPCHTSGFNTSRSSNYRRQQSVEQAAEETGLERVPRRRR